MVKPLVRPQGVFGNPRQARLGAFGVPGGLISRLEYDARGRVVYLVHVIILTGPDNQAPALLKARAAHRYMIASGAALARSRGQPTFKLYGWQANADFRDHTNRLAGRVGVLNSGVVIGLDYEVILVASKVLAENLPLP